MTTTMTDQERIALQREVVAAHIKGENDGDYEFVKSTFVQHDGAYFDCVPGGVHFPGTAGITGWYELLSSLLPDLKIICTHSYDVPGCSLRELTASGTHSAEFAGVQPEGRRLHWEAIALYIFDHDEPGKMIGERAYWDNDQLFKQMKGEEAPPVLGLATAGRR